jgi:hypothetical protein
LRNELSLSLFRARARFRFVFRKYFFPLFSFNSLAISGHTRRVKKREKTTFKRQKKHRNEHARNARSAEEEASKKRTNSPRIPALRNAQI